MRFEELKTYYNEVCKENIVTQHNILVLVGNGFDINILQSFGSKRTTRYEDFYNSVQADKSKRKKLQSNIFMQTMKEEKGTNENWADFENEIPHILNKYENLEKIDTDLRIMQEEFSEYLNSIVTPEIENKLGNSVSEKDKLIGENRGSLNNFVRDLSENEFVRFNFPLTTEHYQIYNYLFLNFNYTNLLDNYINLNKTNFVPEKYKNSKMNFKFKPNPCGFKFELNKRDGDFVNQLVKEKIWKRWPHEKSTKWSSVVRTTVCHPHGQQHIPNSMLFGTNKEEYKNNQLKKYNKEYWAQYDIYYQTIFDQANLFIVYGSSIGESDSWWWKRICDTLCRDYEVKYDWRRKNKKLGFNAPKELIVYSRNHEFDKEEFVDKYLGDKEAKDKVMDRIFVVEYANANDLTFLSIDAN